MRGLVSLRDTLLRLDWLWRTRVIGKQLALRYLIDTSQPLYNAHLASEGWSLEDSDPEVDARTPVRLAVHVLGPLSKDVILPLHTEHRAQIGCSFCILLKPSTDPKAFCRLLIDFWHFMLSQAVLKHIALCSRQYHTILSDRIFFLDKHFHAWLPALAS